MTTAAQHPHLVPVPDLPAAPLEGAVHAPAEIEKAAAPSRLQAAGKHVIDHWGYAPLVGRGYARLGRRWLAGRRDYHLHMIATAEQALAASTDPEEQEDLRDAVEERRARYARHRLVYGTKSGMWATAAVTAMTTGTLTGGLWVTAVTGLAGYLYGVRHGVGDEQTAQAVPAIAHTTDGQPAAHTPGPVSLTQGGMTIEQLPADVKPFPIRKVASVDELATCVLAAMRKDGVSVAEVFDVSYHPWGWQCTVRVSEGTPEAIIKAAGDLETTFDLGTNRLRIQPLKERRACAVLRLMEGNPFATAPAPPYRAPKSISITHRSRVGTSIAGEALELSLAGVMGLIVAASGGGKTGILQSLGEITTACYDNITIDLDPFGDGLEDLHDGVRLTARTTEQIEAVLAFALVLAKGRARLRRKLGMGNKWRPTAEHPALTILFDEFPKASELSQLLAVELLLVGRKECVDLVLASQGGTSRYLGENIAQMIALRLVGTCKRVDTNAVFGDGAAAEGWLPHRLDPATDTDPKDAGHVFAQGVPGLGDEAIEYAIYHLDAATLRKLGGERLEAGLVELDQESIAAMADVDLPEIQGFPKLRSWPALLQLCGAQPPAGQASTHSIVAEAIAVMDERGVTRMRTETLADAMHLTVGELKAKMHAAGVPEPAPIGPIDGLQNPRGYKRDALASA
ncbi:hypothetical protein ACWGHD_04475 [Streptomyces xanthophaeus]